MKFMERVVTMTTVSAKNRLCMQHLGNAMKNLKQHFYKLKKIKMLQLSNKMGKTTLSQEKETKVTKEGEKD